MKKKVLIILSVAAVVLCTAAFLVTNRLKKMADNESKYTINDYSDKIQILYGYSKVIDFAEMSNIQIDEKIENKLEDCTVEFSRRIGASEISIWQTVILGELEYLFCKYDLDTTFIEDELNSRINEENGLLLDYYGDESLENSIDNTHDVLVANEYNDTKGLDKNALEDGLCNCFDEALANLDGEDTSCLSILFYFYEKNELDKLRHTDDEKITSYLDEYSAFEYNSEDSLLSNVSAELDCAENCDILGIEYTEYVEDALEMYNNINSIDQMYFSTEDKLWGLIYSLDLEYCYRFFGTIKNDFINNNINDMLEEHMSVWWNKTFSDLGVIWN